MKSTRSLAMLMAGLAAAGLWGCTGGSGSSGPAGAPAAPAPTQTTLTAAQNLPGVALAITGLAGSNSPFQVGQTMSVTFTVKKGDGTGLPLKEMDYGAIVMSGPTFNYQVVIPRQTDLIAASSQNADGSYTYRFAAPIPATYPAPYNDSASFGAGDGELQGQPLLDGTYTVGIEMYKNYTVGTETFKDVAAATQDFLFGAAAALTPREVVKIDNCNRCHIRLQIHGGARRDTKMCVLCHTAGAEDKNDPAVAGGTPGRSIELKYMIHKIHNGEHLPSVQGVGTNADGSRNYAAAAVPNTFVDGVGVAHDFSGVAFPAWPNLNVAMPRRRGYSALTAAQKTIEGRLLTGVTACFLCHGDPDGNGPLTEPSQGAQHRTQPTRAACGACHDDVDWTLPYVANGKTMPAQADDTNCAACHVPTGPPPNADVPLSVEDVHLHPIMDPKRNAGVNFAITDLTGGTGAGGNFQAGDPISLTFTVKDDAGNAIPLEALDATSAMVVGPTTNRQPISPLSSPNGISVSPFDFAGRLATSSTTNKAAMSKVIGAAVTEILTVQFTSATAFTVTGSTTGALGGSALPASPSTNPTGSSISGIVLTSAAVAQTITVAFSGATDFTVTGSVSGAMGAGSLPASVSGSTRFTSSDGTVAFNVTVGTTAFAAGNSIYLTVFKGAAASPVLFAVVAGRTSVAANDRFYYEANATAASYTVKVPVDVQLEYLGDGNGAVGQVLAAANLPVYYGRQTVWERTALVGAATTLTAASAALGRYVDIAAIDAGLAVGDKVVLDRGVAGLEEYVNVGRIDTTGGLKRVWFSTALRYAHALGASFQEATLTFRQLGVNYTLNPATGAITSVVAFGAGKAVVMTYRTEARFGLKRGAGDAPQTKYAAAINDSPDLDETWGDWAGKTFVDGTYTANIWGYRNLDLGLNNEVQTYRLTSNGVPRDFLYGTASTLAPLSIISTGANCEACHVTLVFHGGSRRGLGTCLMCHGIPGAEDWPLYNTVTSATPAGETPRVTIDYRTMLHKIHQGEELANAATYVIGGNGGSSNMYEEVIFPSMPGRVEHCEKCHGAGTATWKEPSDRNHPTQQGKSVRAWRAVCGACHDSTSAGAHIDLQTSAGGAETCAACHGQGAEFNVELMHKTR